ncbi:MULTISPECIES: hypothetical protein [Streptomyces]|uniref:Uncharacterized protein n=1 Tax=Streptomyces nigrescens TaxID=1920 RepID=A0ABY7IYI9_STRNI|nr:MULTISPECIES: hypothetical protein [Streptomyces]MCX5448220.1 hypothetical protein [Streptomyces libani]WAU03022.1 hypothetical protein STRNI_001119 [Streptomyces nigrescens]
MRSALLPGLPGLPEWHLPHLLGVGGGELIELLVLADSGAASGLP